MTNKNINHQPKNILSWRRHAVKPDRLQFLVQYHPSFTQTFSIYYFL